MKKKYWVLLAMFLILTGFGFSMTTLAAYPAVSESAPLGACGWRLRDYTIYSNSELTEKVCILPYQECEITAITGNAVRITYTDEKNNRKTGWISLKTFVYNPEYKHQVAYANASLILYHRPTIKASSVAVPQFSGGVVVSERGGWVELLFKSGKRYHMGWIKKTTYQSFVRLSMETTTQPLANGTYIISPRNATGKALTWQRDKGTFTVSKNTAGQMQKFTLRYVSGGYYLISPLESNSNLVDIGGLTVSEENSGMWMLTRSGGCFYLREKTGGRGLRYRSGVPAMAEHRKLKTQQWKFSKVSEKPSKENSVVFSQYDPKWGGSTYMDGPSRRTISTSGCGVMALTNAVYALNGEFINPKMIASFSASRGHYFYNQGTNDTLYRDFARVYGKKYHFIHSGKTYSLNTVRKYLKKGSVAIALVPGHYIAIAGYRSASDTFLVLDSAIYGKRPTTIYGDWVSASTLGSGTLWCEYFHILSRRE